MVGNSAIGEFIRTYVSSHSLTINDLAKRMKVPHSTVARWASGEVEPSLKQLNKLANATSTNLCFLVELIYPQPDRGISPDITRLAEQISHLSIPAQELLDSVILGLSMKSNIQNSDVSKVSGRKGS